MTSDAFPGDNRARLEAIFAGDTFVREIGVELVDWGGGHATVRLRPEARHANFVGTGHGGMIFTLADAAIGVASNSWGRVSMLLSAQAQYLTAAPLGEPLLARAAERSRTRRTVSLGIDVTSEESGALRASLQAICFRTGRWHLGEDAWPEDWRAQY
jgi:acyl-CoA thioesterase